MTSKLKELEVQEWAIREVSKHHPDDSGIRLDALLYNRSSKFMKYVDCEIRYFNSKGSFIGSDQDFQFGPKELKKEEKIALSIMLSIPDETDKITILAKAQKEEFLERFMGFGFMGASILVAGILYYLK